MQTNVWHHKNLADLSHAPIHFCIRKKETDWLSLVLQYDRDVLKWADWFRFTPHAGRAFAHYEI